jgi:primosomal protein N' (replication factor Y)
VPGAGRIARVLLESALPQLDRLLDYRVPEELAADAMPGVRVTVPLRTGHRIASGYLIELADQAEFGGELSELESVVSRARVLTPQVWALARKVADRSAGGASDVLRLAIPGRQVRVEKAWLAADAAGRHDAPAAAAPAAAATPAITGYPDGVIESAIASGGRLGVHAIPALTTAPDGTTIGSWARTLAQAAVHTYASGRSAILLVPDYRDQDQLQLALDALAPQGSVARLDARQSNPDRYRAFLSCLDGPRIIVGNRSAVYAPAERLGLIAIWDDGDPLYNEPLSPYVHARDAALVRQEQQNCALLLLAHTRSVEAQRLVEVGWLRDVRPVRAVRPRVVLTAAQFSAGDPAQAAARIPEAAWRTAREAVERGPVLVQVARPGYAPVVACGDCRQAARCARCDGPLGIRSAGATPSCGWCGAIATGWHCPNCEGTRLRLVTRGTGRTAEELGRAFPGVRVIVSDGERIVQQVTGAPALVVATRGAEPIAPGGYAAVLLLDGERMLARENLRVGDDCLRWWSNAAALAAPSAPVVLVGVGGELGQALATWRQDGYASGELADRRQLRFPPAVRIASVTGQPQAVQTTLDAVEPGSAIDVLGPVQVGDGAVRAIVRFEYANGARVAAALRAAVVRNATSAKRAPRGGFRPAPTLRVRFDDPEIL